MKIFGEDNEKKLKEIIKIQEERLKDFLGKKADIETLGDLMNTKASKADFAELSKKYSQLYITIEPLILNQEMFKNLCRKI